MKRIVLAILGVFLVVSLVACSSEKQWTKDEILKLFENKSEANWTIVDCVVADDLAYGCVGVVLFTDNSNTCLAFLNAEGQYSLCSTKAQLAPSPVLNYCGDGVITYMVQSDDGLVYEQKITFKQSHDWDSSGFAIEDNYFEVLAEKQANDRQAD